MCNAYVWPRSVEGQGQSLRLNIVWMLAMMRRCAVPMFDQGWFKVKVKFITFCDSSSLWVHLPLQKKLIPSSDIRGETWLLSFPKAPSSCFTGPMWSWSVHVCCVCLLIPHMRSEGSLVWHLSILLMDSKSEAAIFFPMQVVLSLDLFYSQIIY